MTSIPAARIRLIEQVVNAARRQRQRPAEGGPHFLRQYYRGVAEEDLAEYAPADLAARALAHLHFGSTRARNDVLVQVTHVETQHRGTATTHTAIDVVAPDMPFLVDSIGIVLNRAGLAVHLMVHPVLYVRRDRRGRLLEVHDDSEAPTGFTAESWQHIEVSSVTETAALEALRTRLLDTLHDVRVAVTDWQTMRRRALEAALMLEQGDSPVPMAERREAADMLRWMEDDHFTFLGYREYRLRRGRSADSLEVIPRTGLGILRQSRNKGAPFLIRGDLRELARKPEALVITKANALATVHRAAYLDYVGVKLFDAQDRVNGERRFLGLFTSAAYHRNPREIPILRHKVRRVIEHFDLDPASHDGKAVEHVLETYPRDELFQSSVATLIHNVRGIVNLYERHRVRVFLRRDVFGRFYSGLIFIPRDRYNTQVRERIEQVIREQLAAEHVDSQVQISESALARVHVIARLPRGAAVRVDMADLERRIAATVRTWHDRLHDALVAQHGATGARTMLAPFAAAFPASYEEEVDVATAIDDLEQLQAFAQGDDHMQMRLVAGDTRDSVHLRLFHPGAPLPLSRALPILENLGFVVISEQSYRISLRDQVHVWLQNFAMRTPQGARLDPATLNPRFTAAFVAAWTGDAENDGFNRLVTLTPLHWRQAMLLRAYCRFILQTSVTFSQPYMEQVLSTNAAIAVSLYELFAAQFDPELPTAERTRRVARLEQQLNRQLDQVTSLDDDRILRRFAGAIRATLRTNYFVREPNGALKSYCSFKLNPQALPDLPAPRPAFEIFVYSPRVEGVHLRMGAVARGGIRWSDRREDFRTEVLGLMKAQHVKNALIVPVGAKGGFVAKRLPTNGSRDDTQREGIECYRLFIRGMLDITDNIVGGRVVPPANVVRRDGDDAYLVVAADKGTAKFSDIANNIAAEYNFWLGDAFASGGSAGYDHKAMGITARGAWECVKRHFRELGRDVQSEDFTVAGIGDMSGDVFGNGMLRSTHIRLLAAFNHQHIFLDPNPDAATSFRERQRLFALQRSNWTDYDTRLISTGGGVFSRTAKSVRLSPQVQAMLGVQRETMTPPELIRAILCMPVDLLWNGGIGTYVKATDESHLEVGDRANDAVRVNGAELRCKVVGEGGNLGFSQRGRIEYARQGGRINTDFVDNSAGVDCSDHEVNIKVLLNAAPKRARIPLGLRNQLLERMTDDVAALVLRDNYMQSQALSVMESRAAEDLLEHAHLIRSLEVTGQLDRGLEFLPSPEDIGERHKAGQGLTRPELAILLSYAKMALYSRLIESDVPEDDYLAQELTRYFPAVMQRRCDGYLHLHPLRREIIATTTTNSLVNRMGATFARRAHEETGADAATVARAFTISREALEMRATWSAIEALDNAVPATVQCEMLYATTRLLRFCTYWLIQHCAGALDISGQVSRLQPGLAVLTSILPQVLAGNERSTFEQRLHDYRAAGVPEALARRIAGLPALRAGLDLVEIEAQTGWSMEDAARTYFGLGDALSLDWIREQIETLTLLGHWHAVARSALRESLYRSQRALTLQVFTQRRKRDSAAAALQSWLATHRPALEHVRTTLSDMRSSPIQPDFAMLSVAVQAVERLTER